MKRYRFTTEAETWMIWVYSPSGARQLTPEASLRIRNLSPTGFRWGYGGSGPAQAALAVLFDYSGDPKMAAALYQAFKWRFIAEMPTIGGEITGEQIDAFIAEMRQELEEFA